MAIRNYSITADEYVINKHLIYAILDNSSWDCEKEDTERLLNQLKLDQKREILKDLKSSNNESQYLRDLKVRLLAQVRPDIMEMERKDEK